MSERAEKASLGYPAAAVLLACLACTGEIDDAGPSDPAARPTTGGAPGPGLVPAGSGSLAATSPGLSPGSGSRACGSNEPGVIPMRRLTRFEYDNTVRDLLGDGSAPAGAFPPDEKDGVYGFDNSATARGVTELLADGYLTAAERLAAGAVRDLPRLLGCDPTRDGLQPCGRRFVETFGRRAWRGPLDADETSALLAVFTAGAGRYDVATGARMTLEVMLQSPRFLYRVEQGTDPTPGRVSRVMPFELAARLSYVLWGSMPDDVLLNAAASGALAGKESVAMHALRMLEDPRARRMMAHFNAQWLPLEGIARIEKDRKLFPTFGPEMPGLFKEETERFLDEVLWRGDGTLRAVLSAPFTFMNKALAAFYGLAGPAGTAFERVQLDGNRRGGLLTQGAVLASLAHVNQTSPVARGMFVREQLLCDKVLPPPDDVEIKVPDVSPTATTRERLEQHRSVASCAGCHALMDPIGLAFETYDAVGRWRDVEAGKPIDASGEILGSDVAGKFTGVRELASRLMGSAQANDCVLRMWFRYAQGRMETADDACALEPLRAAFAAGRNDVRRLLVALTQLDVFYHRRMPVLAGGQP